MKLNRIFTLVALGAAMLFTTSCSNDFSYDGRGTWDADANYANLYFPISSSTDVVDPAEEPIATIELCRRNTSGALSVPLTIAENTDNVFKVGTANFAEGDSVAVITIDYSAAGVGTPYTLRLEIEGTGYVSSYSEDISFTYSVTRVKWNDVGYYIDEDGNTVEGYAMYTDDFITTFFGVDNVSFPTKLQERDDMPGYFRMVNTYHANYPYNDPGDWDDSQDYYIFIDATDPTKVTIPELCSTGMDWGYDFVKVYSLAGYYLARGDEATAASYYGTYENGAITFPASSLLINMDGYSVGSLYTANGNGAFKLVIDPSKDLYTATVEDYDFDTELLFSGEYASKQMGTKKDGVAIYKGVRKDDVEAANKGCYDRFEDTYGGVPYMIKSPYADGYDLVFIVTEENKILPVKNDDYAIQPIGVTALNMDIYAAIQSSSKFDEKEISLDIVFQTKPNSNGEYTEFALATETLSNITWTKVGTGTYTYTAFLEGVDPGLEIYQRDDQPTSYKVTDWGYGVDLFFTWDGESKATLPAAYIGYTHPSYGDVYVSDFYYYGGYSYDDYPCTYDAATHTFTFTAIYWVEAGYFGYGEETLEVDWDAAAASFAAAAKSRPNTKATAKRLSTMKKHSFFGNGVKKSRKAVKTPSSKSLFVK